MQKYKPRARARVRALALDLNLDLDLDLDLNLSPHTYSELARSIQTIERQLTKVETRQD